MAKGVISKDSQGSLFYPKGFKKGLMVPVVDKNGKPLMPTTSARARRWIRDRKATYFYQKGVFCVRLNFDPSNTYQQDIACGIDPGGTWEAMTLKSKKHTILNVQSTAVSWV